MAKKRAAKTVKKATKKSAKPKTAGAADAIRQLDAEFMKAASAKNAGALVKAFYVADAVLMPPNHPIVSGRAEIQRFLQGLIDSGLTSIKLETTTIASSGDLAYGRGHYTLSMAPAGGTPFQDAGKYIVVYGRQANGAWRAVADIFNSDQAAQ
jgi:ketosteroid isomerase-like protein